MLAVISKAFGFSKSPEQDTLLPRQINLSGNLISFAMPENFSQDMPAEDMIETANLSDTSLFQDPQRFTLIRRWWDFKNSSFFARDQGTLMMSIYIKAVDDSSPATTLKPMDFIDIIINDIEKNKPAESDSLAVYADYFPAYKENWINGQRWLAYLQGHTDHPQLTMLYAIPVTDKRYIVVEFVSAASSNTSIRAFVDHYTEPFIENIMNTFHLEYTAENPASQAMLKADSTPLQQLIDEKLKRLEQ